MIEKVSYFLAMAFLELVLVVFCYLITAGLTFVIFFCFGLEWSWIKALGAYAALILMRIFLVPSKSK